MSSSPHGSSSLAHRRETNTKLEVVNIPVDQCTIHQVQQYFSQFGTIVNLHVNTRDHAALLEYATVDEATRAHTHPEAPFNNRFVKIFWHRGGGGGGAAAANGGTTMTTSMMTGVESSTTPQLPVVTNAVELTPEERQRKQEEAQRMRDQLQAQMEELKRKQDEERRNLMAKMQQMSDADRATIMKSLSSVTQTIASTPGILEKTGAQLKSISGGGSRAAAAAHTTTTGVSPTTTFTDYKKEKLDRELMEMMATGGTSTTAIATDSSETADQLRNRLEAMKAQVFLEFCSRGRLIDRVFICCCCSCCYFCYHYS